MEPDKTAPIRAVLSGSTLFVEEASKTFQQTKKADNFVVIGALRVNTKIRFVNQFLGKQITCSPTLLAQTKYYSCV